MNSDAGPDLARLFPLPMIRPVPIAPPMAIMEIYASARHYHFRITSTHLTRFERSVRLLLAGQYIFSTRDVTGIVRIALLVLLQRGIVAWLRARIVLTIDIAVFGIPRHGGQVVGDERAGRWVLYNRQECQTGSE